MTVREPVLVQRVRARLTGLAWSRAILIGLAAGIVAWLIAVTLARLSGANGAVFSLAAGASIGIGVGALIRKRDGTVTRTRAALWLEEQFPSLQFALVTLADFDGHAGRALSDDARARLVAAVGEPPVAGALTRSAQKQLLLPAVVALFLAASALPLHARLVRLQPSAALTSRGAGTSAALPAVASTKALANWRVRVIPPAYTSIDARALGDVGVVNAIVGSVIEVSGGDAISPDGVVRSVVDTVRPSALRISRNTDSWHTQLLMPALAAEIRFTLNGTARQLLLEPRPDSLPTVRLQLPLRDSVFRVSKGSVALEAVAHDDFGMASANFELIVTSGEGERFTAKTVAVALQRLNGDRESHWFATMLLDTMKLEQGDIVHMRAVARDRHPDASREMGISETRTFRIARQNEYDSVAVEPAPPPEVQKSLMSQRMLLILTEKLEQRRPSLTRDVLVSESRRLAAEQVRLRKVVGDLVFQRLEGEAGAEHAHSAGDGHDHGVVIEQGKLVPTQAAVGMATGAPPPTDFEGDESPVIGVNKPLLEAYNAMWDAASALDIADPKTSIPHMKLALAAIQRARSAERIYLRGKPPVVIVDIAKVWLAGKDTGQVNARTARDALAPKEAEREARLLAAALLVTSDASAGRDSLAVLRLESLTAAPRFAAALSDVLEIVRRGGEATAALVRARRLLNGSAAADSLSRWRGTQ